MRLSNNSIFKKTLPSSKEFCDNEAARVKVRASDQHRLWWFNQRARRAREGGSVRLCRWRGRRKPL